MCVTEGILQLLSERELRGVLGHELQHVYNRDILTSSVAAAIAGIITSIAQFLQFTAIFGGRGGDERGNPLAALAVAFLAPVAASVIQMAISRTREFEADADGAELTGRPMALASALAKIGAGTARRPMEVNPAVSQLFIDNPLKAVRGQSFATLFATRPPIEERIRRLHAMASGIR